MCQGVRPDTHICKYIHTLATATPTPNHTHSPTYNYTCLLHIFFSYFSFECCKSALQLDIFLKPSGALQYLSFQCVCVCMRGCMCVCGKVVTLPKFWQSCEMNFEWRRIISKWNLKRLPAATELLPSFSLCLFYLSPSPPAHTCYASDLNLIPLLPAVPTNKWLNTCSHPSLLQIEYAICLVFSSNLFLLFCSSALCVVSFCPFCFFISSGIYHKSEISIFTIEWILQAYLSIRLDCM